MVPPVVPFVVTVDKIVEAMRRNQQNIAFNDLHRSV
jgi:hypothetical protein